jgi:O-antigen ligase
LAATLIAGAVLSIVLSGFQLLGGPGSPLRFYQITNPNRAVGFFSNASHLTTLILCALPITAVLAARAVKSRSSQKQGAGLTLGGSLAAFLAAGVVISNSTAGYGLFMPAALMSFLVFRRAAIGPLSKTWAVALIAFSIAFVAIALSGSLAQQTIADKFSEHPTSRGTIWATTMTAAKAFAPVGSGLGTFAGVYRTFDPVDRASNLFVNHAHNDYLEMALELGVAGLLLVLGFLIWAVRRTMRAWLEDFDGATLARAGSAIIALILLHSVVEYPLRTSALAAVFALACAFLVPPPARLRKQGEHGGTEIGGGKLKHVEAD